MHNDVARRDDNLGLTQSRETSKHLNHRILEDWGQAMGWGAWWPALDLVNEGDRVVVKAEVPGLKPEDLEIAVSNHMLTISGTKRDASEEKGKNYCHLERRYGSFRRNISLPAEVKGDKVEAICHDGVLTVTLPKAKISKPLKVKVKV
jgi:HSP20 family protein